VPDPSKEANIELHFDAKNRVNKSDCVDQKDGRDMRTNLSLAFELSPLVGHVAPLARKLQKLLLDFSVLHLAGTQFALLRPGAIFFRLGHDRRPFVRYMANTSGQQNVPPGRGRGAIGFIPGASTLRMPPLRPRVANPTQTRPRQHASSGTAGRSRVKSGDRREKWNAFRNVTFIPNSAG
jgi:hypothetical protein